ncbi:hypothetical protein [Leptospira idonii]|uniref:Uncharacterized protein n=1 Tax=Leptospira idonii TaxID=1193500 RepID=A0A4R9LYZ7_9LEPT|nr:hypothetical protein [Leptospira idonii]TGN18952.1 hypothetical protein EHS15_11075 [Leptospira idonii]
MKVWLFCLLFLSGVFVFGNCSNVSTSRSSCINRCSAEQTLCFLGTYQQTNMGGTGSALLCTGYFLACESKCPGGGGGTTTRTRSSGSSTRSSGGGGGGSGGGSSGSGGGHGGSGH